MTRAKGTIVKSQARSERARALYAALPKDEKGRLMKRGAAPRPAGDPGAERDMPSAGGASPEATPFTAGRGLRRFRHRSS